MKTTNYDCVDRNTNDNGGLYIFPAFRPLNRAGSSIYISSHFSFLPRRVRG
ncbi:MAG: hypothetical protein A4E65_03711 [Syntrophorhabdus sp. PtaU1.Bin153]|nr:MAG: hypothetical protein A4E65_03711 [Syntrophorhabdus sp. PtaU1.Bin153]